MLAADGLGDSSDNPLIFYSSPLPLISIASSKLALMCWHHQIDDLYIDEKSIYGGIWFTHHKYSSAEILQVSGDDRARIDRQIKYMGKELQRWWYRHESIFGHKWVESLLEFIDHLNLDPADSISYVNTARNLLASGKLSPIEEFKLACGYCFETDVVRLWPLVSDHDRIKNVTFADNPTMFYWICRLKHELNKIPGDRRQSVEYRLISSDKLKLWSEIEYFWNKLTEREKTSRIKPLLSRQKFAIGLLPKLNKTRLDAALRSNSMDIMRDLAKHDMNFGYALRTWNYFLNDKTASRKYFEDIMNVLFNLAFIDEGSYYDHVAVLLYDIWSSVPTQFKKRILRDGEGFFDGLMGSSFTFAMTNCDMRWYGRDLRFHKEIFAEVTRSWHWPLWNNLFPRLMLVARPRDLDTFYNKMNYDESEIESFKEYEMMEDDRMLPYFNKFIENGLCFELFEYLEYFSPDEETLRKIMRKIIDSNLDRMHKFKTYDTVMKFKDFVDRAFPSPDQAEQFKRELINQRIKSWYKLLDETQLDGVRNIIQCFVTFDANLLAKIKQQFFERCKRNLTTGTFTTFYAREWETFLMWCAPNETEYVKFKKSIRIDKLFDILVTKAMQGAYAVIQKKKPDFARPYQERFTNPDVVMSFCTLRTFLLWYFESEELANKFKSHVMFSFVGRKAMERLVLENYNNGETFVYLLLWFFNNDKEKCTEFLVLMGAGQDESTE